MKNKLKAFAASFYYVHAHIFTDRFADKHAGGIARCIADNRCDLKEGCGNAVCGNGAFNQSADDCALDAHCNSPRYATHH